MPVVGELNHPPAKAKSPTRQSRSPVNPNPPHPPHLPCSSLPPILYPYSIPTLRAAGHGVRQTHQAMMNGDGYDECRLQVVVPRSWKWSSLPDFCHRLPAINTHEIPTFKALVDHCWEIACGEVCVCARVRAVCLVSCFPGSYAAAYMPLSPFFSSSFSSLWVKNCRCVMLYIHLFFSC